METIVDLLASAGFVADGATESIVMPTAGTHRCGRADVGGRVSPGRRRFKRGEDRVTVGPRTTCFYRVVSGSARDFQNIRTKDVHAIKSTLDQKGGMQA
jgi:hypothetical protein